jgi:hypothetical protein
MYHGDILLGDTIDIKFTTVNASGVPTTLAGTPVVSAYPGNSTTEITAGITLTVDFDARTGLHNVRVVATGGNGYAVATNYTLVITTGTVGGSSVVGYVVGSFSIENRSAATQTEVNTEVVDVMTVDSQAEPTGVPAASDDIATKLGYLYMALRNQLTITATKKQFFDDGGAAEWEKDLSDDGTTYTETEGNAP